MVHTEDSDSLLASSSSSASIEYLGLSGYARTGFKSHHDWGDKWVYFVNGLNSNGHAETDLFVRFDIINRKWEELPKLPSKNWCPATYICQKT